MIFYFIKKYKKRCTYRSGCYSIIDTLLQWIEAKYTWKDSENGIWDDKHFYCSPGTTAWAIPMIIFVCKIPLNKNSNLTKTFAAKYPAVELSRTTAKKKQHQHVYIRQLTIFPIRAAFSADKTVCVWFCGCTYFWLARKSRAPNIWTAD